MTDTLSTADLAAEVGVSRQMIARWSREGLQEAAKIKHGKWDRERALSWIADRREDSPYLDGQGNGPSELVAARIRLYQVQAVGADIRNKAAESLLIYRERATGTFASMTAECIAAGDAWARDHTTPACAVLLEHVSAAAALAIKAEIWNELRQRQADAVRRVEVDLAAGEDVGPTRVRISGRVGRR